MLTKKNEATITYKTRQFVVYQNVGGDWCFSYDDLNDVSTGSKELQAALNIAYESIDDRVSYHHSQTIKNRQIKPKKNLIEPKKKSKKAGAVKLQAL